MRTGHFLIGACVAAFLFFSAFRFVSDASDIERLPVGSKLPEPAVEMKGVDGERHSLGSAAEENGLLVLFTGSGCSWVKAWEDRYNEIAALAAEHDVGMIAVNSNAAARDDGDGLVDMRERAQEEAYRFPYVMDAEAVLADAFGATTVPEVFLFDDDNLVYRGAIDDNPRNASAVDEPYLKQAVRAVGAGKTVKTQSTEPVGCEIERPER